MTSGEDWDLWKWLAGGACTIFAAVIAGSFTAGRSTKGIELRIEALEEHRERQDEYCKIQKADLIDAVKKEIRSIVSLAIKDVIIDHNSKLATISTNQALQGQALQQIQDDVTAIFGRMNRRGDDHDQHTDRRMNP